MDGQDGVSRWCMGPAPCSFGYCRRWERRLNAVVGSTKRRNVEIVLPPETCSAKRKVAQVTSGGPEVARTSPCKTSCLKSRRGTEGISSTSERRPHKTGREHRARAPPCTWLARSKRHKLIPSTSLAWHRGRHVHGRIPAKNGALANDEHEWPLPGVRKVCKAIRRPQCPTWLRPGRPGRLACCVQGCF